MGKGHAQTQTFHLFRQNVAVIARNRTESDTSTGHQRRTSRTLTSVTSTFLLEGLFTAPAHFAASFCFVCALTTASQLPAHHGLKDFLFDRHFEDRSVE